MKIFISFFIFTLMGLVGCSFFPKTVWTGKEIAVGTGDRYFHNVGWMPNFELGLRSDGVLVWREKKP